MNFFEKTFRSSTFRKIAYISFAYVILLWVLNKYFDGNWKYTCMRPAVNLDDVYKIPEEYDNFPIINLKMLDHNMLGIEGNQEFKIIGNNSDFNYYDSTAYVTPDTAFSYENKIYLKFRNSFSNDSIYFVVAHSANNGIFWNQVFYSSVKIQNLNEYSANPEKFRLNYSKLVSSELLNNNDTLINLVKNYFNSNISSLGLAECGTNSRVLKSICTKYNLPCKIITLQGGDSYEAGFNDMTGYPIHVVCEIFSSRYAKWYVMDPSYGTVFIRDGIPMNAAEISNAVYNKREGSIVQDSVLATRKNTLGEDYYNYYRNIYFSSENLPNIFIRQVIKYFFNRYNYLQLHYSNVIDIKRNGSLYIEKKAFMYLIISAIYLSVVFVLLIKKLYELRKLNY